MSRQKQLRTRLRYEAKERTRWAARPRPDTLRAGVDTCLACGEETSEPPWLSGGLCDECNEDEDHHDPPNPLGFLP